MSSLTPAVSTSSTPFFVIPASHPASSARFPIPATVQHYRPSFPIESIQRPAATAAAATPVVAHKHAHHLHSIPPKQKSTKSLIIDHLLWSHTRTRLAQIAAQLGVAELEQEEENDEEEVLEEEQLCSRMGYGQQQRQQRQQPSTSSTQRRINLVQARALKARADGFERVLAAMLASSSSSSSPENLFPEHVRFRITLGTLIHDLFNPPSATTLSTAVVAPTTITNGSQQQQSGSEGGVTKEKKQRKKTKHVPECFRAMSSRRPAFSSSPISPTSSSSSPSSSFPLNTTLANQHSRAQQLFNAGVASHHHQSRCTRHFSQTCEVCIPSATRPVVSVNGIGSGLSNPTNGKPFGLSILHEGTNANEEGTRPCFEALQLFLQLSAFMMQEILREAAKAQHNDEGEESEDEDEEGDDTRSVVSSSSGSFTSVESGTQHGGSSTRPASRNASHDEMNLDVVVAANQHQQQENWSSLPSLLPSSSNKLVKRRPEGEKKKKKEKKTLSFAFPSFSTTTKPSIESVMDVPAPAVESEVVVQPTKAWYALLASLLTHIALEGYLCHGWKGTEELETLFGIGASKQVPAQQTKKAAAGLFSRGKGKEDQKMGAMEESKSTATARLDCGWLPSLDEAATTLLFGFGSSPLVREYVSEMEQRLHEFVTIPSEVSDLTVHLESLANKYASEPMEIALLRFFEVVSSWKGVPELEEYKQGQTRPVSHSSHHSQSVSRSDANGIVTIPALVCPLQVQAPSSFRSSPYNGIEQQQHSQHSRSPSIQSTSSMVHQSPGYHRHHLPLAPKRSDSRSAAAAAATATTSATTSPSVPSISIASLIHHHHPVVVPGEAKLLPQSHAHAQQQQPRQNVYSTNSLNPSMESMITEEEEEDEEEEEEESFRRLPLELFFTVPVQLRKARARARAAAARNSAATATAATVVGPSARTSPQTSLPVTPTGSMKSVNVPLLPSVDKLMVVVPAGTRDVGVGLGLTTTATTTATATATSPAGARGTGVGGSFERWSNFTVLGSKRARESDEVERPAKKALFVTTGRYNT